jgi:hypothetical protein
MSRAEVFKKVLKIACLRNDTPLNDVFIESVHMPRSTFYYKLKHASFTHLELITIFKAANFTASEIIEVMQ